MDTTKAKLLSILVVLITALFAVLPTHAATDTLPTRPPRVIQLIATHGSSSHCALLSTGIVMCHGSNWYGLLGRGQVNYTYDYTPQAIAWTHGKITELFTIGNKFCGAVEKHGGLVCWGENAYGELGRGFKSYSEATPDYFAPANGMDVKSVNWIYGGICVLSHDGTLACAGDLNDCELEGMSKLPAKGITSFSASYSSSCALIDKGAKCWGWKDGEGLVCTPWDVTYQPPIGIDPVPPLLWMPLVSQ